MRFLGSVIFLIVILNSCSESITTNVSMGNDFTMEGNGLMVATVEEGIGNVLIKGELQLIEGKFEIFLINPQQDTLIYEIYDHAGKYTLNQLNDRMLGDWEFRYVISKIKTENPSGSFKYSLIFND
jgi:hypothetical protein